jgi:hypothetical protein
MGNGLIGVVVAAAIWIALFLIFRAIVLWYWRINEGIALLKSINEKLDRIAGITPESKEPYIRWSGRVQRQLRAGGIVAIHLFDRSDLRWWQKPLVLAGGRDLPSELVQKWARSQANRGPSSSLGYQDEMRTRQDGATTCPLLTTKTSRMIPIVKQMANATADASAPNAPLVSQSGPISFDCSRPLLFPPETVTEKMPPCLIPVALRRNGTAALIPSLQRLRTRRLPIKLGKTAEMPRPHREDEGPSFARLGCQPITLNDLRAFSRGRAKCSLDVCESVVGQPSPVQKELFLDAGKRTREELVQEFLMNVFLHRTARPPAEMPASE